MMIDEGMRDLLITALEDAAGYRERKVRECTHEGPGKHPCPLRMIDESLARRDRKLLGQLTEERRRELSR